MAGGSLSLHVLSLPDYKTVAQLAPFGEGPDEFNDIRMIPTEETDKLCYVWNIRNNRIFSLSTTLKLEEYDQLAEIPENKIVPDKPLYMGDGKMQVSLGSMMEWE